MIDDLLQPTRPGAWPDTDGFRRAVAEAGRRRRHRARRSAACVGAGLALVTLLATRPGGTTALEPVRPAPASAPAATRSARPAPPPAPFPGAAARPAAVPGLAATTSVTPEAMETPSMASARPRPRVAVYASRTLTPRTCWGPAWCMTPSVYDAPDGASTFTLTLCGGPAAAPSVHFPNRDEVDFRVLHRDEVVWQWSADRPQVEHPHDVEIDPVLCLTWTVEWDGRLADGTRVRPGYIMEARVDGTPVPDTWVNSSSPVPVVAGQPESIIRG